MFFSSASAQTEPKVTTDTRFARGATMAFGRIKASTANGSAISELGFCWAGHPAPTVDENKTTTKLNNNGAIYWLKDLQPATLYYMRAYAKAKDGSVGYGQDIKFYTLPKGQISLTVRGGGDQATYNRIKNAAETAVEWWNNLTEMKGFNPNVGFESGTPTADCSYGGWVRVGPNQSYQRCGTIMHEFLHGVGVIPSAGTAWSGSDLRSGNGRGLWLGDRVTEVLRFWDNSTTAQLNGDDMHMWPYGINGAQEDNGSDVLYIGNSLICQALGEDGLQHTGNLFAEPYYALNQEDTIKYYLKSEDEEYGLYTAFLIPNASGALRWRNMSGADALQNDSAAWYITFTPENQYYQLRNAATGRYMTFASGFKTVERATPTEADDFHLMRGRVDVAGSGSNAFRGYWIIHPSNNWTPNCLKVNANGAVASQQFSLANSATVQRWLILSADEVGVFEQNAMQQLRKEATATLTPIKALAQVPHTTEPAEADQLFSNTIAAIEQQIADATTTQELLALKEQMQQAAVEFLNAATPTHASQPFDLTYMIQNAGMDATDGWSVAATINYSCAEFYEKNFNFYQIVKNLPKGTFRFMAQGFQRPGTSADTYNDFAQGTNKVNAYIYAGTANSKLAHIASEAQTKKLGGTEATVGSNYYIPQDMQAARKYFDKGLYDNGVVVENNTASQLRVGLSCSNMGTSYWCIFDNFRLFFYGSLNAEAINGIATPAAPVHQSDERIYSLDGRLLSTPKAQLQHGLYIVNGKKVVIK